ncbi:hypothetical protein ACXYTP_21965 [Tsukamurella ocularis]|uniref:hypothetical protein n=1 Tax=Tsukamurella ocularis TaxID=1970234 RepID=UPI0039F0E53B
MPVVTRAPGGHPRSRFLLGVFLAVTAFVHLARIGSIPGAEADASCAGLAIVYTVLVIVVLLGERWGYLAAAAFPLIGLLLGDYRSFAYFDDPIDAMDPVVELLVVPIAVYVLRSTARVELQDRCGLRPGPVDRPG